MVDQGQHVSGKQRGPDMQLGHKRGTDAGIQDMNAPSEYMPEDVDGSHHTRIR